ncbi:MAG: LPP20 family lipoprotein [Bacteroidota bacterium]
MMKLVAHIVVGMLLTSCSIQRLAGDSANVQNDLHNAKNESEETIERPIWVKNKPDIPGHYVGIGSARTLHPDFMRMAKEKALEDLASEISIQLSAETKYSQSEYGQQVAEYFSQSIRTSVTDKLSGYVKVDEWSDGERYWISYKLSDDEYRKEKAIKRMAIEKKATAYFESALQRRDDHQYYEAINLFLKTLDVLFSAPDETFFQTINERETLLIPYCIKSVNQIISQVKPRHDAIVLDPVNGKPASISFSINEISASGFRMAVGGTDFDLSIDGTLYLKESEIVSKKILKISLMNNFYQFGNNVRYKQLIEQLLLFPVYNITISSKPVSFELVGYDFLEGDTIADQRVKPFLIKHLAEAGIMIAKSEETGYRLNYQLQTDQKLIENGLFTVRVSLSISLVDSQGKVRYSDRLDNIKGIHNSYANAYTQAVGKIRLKLKEQLILPLIDQLF